VQSDQVSVAVFDPHDFQECAADLDVVQEKLALEASPGRGRQDRGEADVDQNEQPRGADVKQHGGDLFPGAAGHEHGQQHGGTRFAPRPAEHLRRVVRQDL
jgi:hypothetical protein